MAAAAYAYDTPGFAAFYEKFLSILPPEYEVGEDIKFYLNFLLAIGSAHSNSLDDGHLHVLDLACGTGRVLLSIFDCLLHLPNAQNALQHQIHLTGIDLSSEMLTRARANTPTNMALPKPAEVTWINGDLSSFECKTHLQRCQLIVVAAGSFHHLLHTPAQLSALRCIRAHLSSSALSVAVVDVFSNDELCGAQGESKQHDSIAPTPTSDIAPTAVGSDFVHTFCGRAITSTPEGDMIVCDTFTVAQFQSLSEPTIPTILSVQLSETEYRERLVYLPSSSSASTAAQRGAEQGSPAATATLQWSLRTIRHSHLRQLVENAGMAVFGEYTSFTQSPFLGGSPCAPPEQSDTGKRIFVIGLPQFAEAYRNVGQPL